MPHKLAVMPATLLLCKPSTQPLSVRTLSLSSVVYDVSVYHGGGRFLKYLLRVASRRAAAVSSACCDSVKSARAAFRLSIYSNVSVGIKKEKQKQISLVILL
jgi:hypothetical protein